MMMMMMMTRTTAAGEICFLVQTWHKLVFKLRKSGFTIKLEYYLILVL